ncbi:glycoside hydrolase family 2 protein [Paenibacillus gansuensis]|uniref:beta-mannosidase n=1 Tax=Paenibacillus gansuensis TaxID=306542 RepID=A0ABW5PA52_9BACL
MITYTMNSTWQLYYLPQTESTLTHPVQLGSSGLTGIPAVVPGNVELDMMREGILPDLFIGSNIKLLREYESYEWWYETHFEAPEDRSGQVELVFHGVDCLATYWLNGENIGTSDNMLIAHQFDVTDTIRRENHLVIRLQSPLLEAMKKRYEPSMHAQHTNWEHLWVRKAGHSYGWDIMPRALSAGIWRPVELVLHEPNEFTAIAISTIDVSPDLDRAQLNLFYQFRTDPVRFFDGLEIRVTGRCQEFSFHASKPAVFGAGSMMIEVEDPKLWWPRGYGEADLYEVTVELVHQGKIVTVSKEYIGIRLAELIRTETTTLLEGGEFLFKMNHTPILCKGSNWVPLDVFHGRDSERLDQALTLFVEADCNIVRCWGGNVYEDHAFYEKCDRLGLMVWQDFALACAHHPQSTEFTEQIRAEARSIVRALRNHPSLVLWCGDNECDEFYMYRKLDPSYNKLTREVLPEVVRDCDPYRAYLPSSPFMAPTVAGKYDWQLAPERHLWGPRDYFKSQYYKASTYHFVSEIGYHGCPNLSSLQRFLDTDRLWPWQDNEQWIAHATETIGKNGPYASRIQLMADQIREMFGEVPDNLESFIVASQISQAEAKKFFIEMTRIKKWRRTGIIWWNMLDGWPQFSDAVVDYYFGKKLAYHYIRRVQQPVCIMIDEPDNWHVSVVVGNDSRQAAKGTYRVWDADSGDTLLEGAFTVSLNENRTLGSIRISHADHRLFLIEWTLDGTGRTLGNHYLLGFPGFSLERYCKWLPNIAGLIHDFDAAEVGQ